MTSVPSRSHCTYVSKHFWCAYMHVDKVMCEFDRASGRMCVDVTANLISCKLDVSSFCGEDLKYLSLNCYSLIAFDERVTFWLQRVWSLPFACAHVALLCNHYAITYAYNGANTHAQGIDWVRWSQKCYSIIEGYLTIVWLDTFWTWSAKGRNKLTN